MIVVDKSYADSARIASKAYFVRDFFKLLIAFVAHHGHASA